MTGNSRYVEINNGKQNFNKVYNQPEPAPYFETLGKFDYAIPGEAKPVLQRVIEARRQTQDDDSVTVLDIGCSYGINAALLKYDLEMEQLYEWYEERPNGSLQRALELDRRFFAEQEQQPDLAVIGMDPADKAIDYAVEAGLLDAGITANLEEAPMPSQAWPALRDVDLIASTGAIGYVTERTFQQIIPAIDAARAPWVASFVLRMFPYDDLAHTFTAFGMTTEKLSGMYFPQRRFASTGEEAHMRARLEAMDIDPEPELKEGRYLAEFYLSRPFHEAAQRPLRRLFGNLPQRADVPEQPSAG